MLRPTATNVKVMSNYRLLITYDNGEQRIFDVSPYIKGDWYSELKDHNYFKLVKPNGITIEWPNGQDLDPDSVYYSAEPVK